MPGTHATSSTRARVQGRRSSGWPRKAGGEWGAVPHCQRVQCVLGVRAARERRGARFCGARAAGAGTGRRVGPPEAALPGQAGSPALEATRHAVLGFRVPACPAARLHLPPARAWARGEGEGAAQAARPGERREACTAPARAAPARGPALLNRSLTALLAARGGRRGGRAERGGGGGGGQHTKGREGGGGLIVRSP